MAILRSRNNWTVVTKDSNLQKGPLVRVQVAPGQFVKMYQAEAEARGLIPAEKKKIPQGTKIKKPEGDKIRKPEGDKSAQSSQPEENPDPIDQSTYDAGGEADPNSGADDFIVIRGVGVGAARALKTNGIETFDQLLACGDLEYLTPKVNKAIQNWRDANG